jgi:hypothetical protein
MEEKTMGFFSKLFGSEEHNANAGVNIQAVRETIRSEVNISECIGAHMKWKGRLQRYVDGTSTEVLDPAVICRDDQCVLGKWIHGPALKHFHNSDGFDKLRTDHATFHLVAGAVVKKLQDNDRAGSARLLSTEYAQASREVIQDLMELDEDLRAE